MPGTDTDFWLEYAKSKITAGVEARDKAAEKLDTFLALVWGIYIAVFALGSFFDLVTDNTSQLITLLLPIIVIMVARYACTSVLMPVDSVEIDPSIVTEIISGYDQVVRIKSRRLNVARFWTFVSIFSLVTALYGYNYFDTQKELKGKLQVEKLKKSLKEQDIITNEEPDTLKRRNSILESEINILINRRKKACLQGNNDSCLIKLKEILK